MKLNEAEHLFKEVFGEIRKVIVGQDDVLRQIVVALMCDGNALLESYPGLAKTLSIKTLADIMDLSFSRIQSTPDLLPADITGTYIIGEEGNKKYFKFQKGPIFANIVLVDEVNRASPKTQSAFLEAMQEKQVTVGNSTFKLDLPFFVLATMNPIEQDGTFPLPEAQSDRFLFKIKLDYPTFDQELEIVDRFTGEGSLAPLKKIFKKEYLEKLQKLVREVPIARDIKQYAVKVVTSTRHRKDLIEYGASPRASIGLILAAKANALINGRKFVSKQDVNEMAYPILRHRIILNFETQRNNMTEDEVIKNLLR